MSTRIKVILSIGISLLIIAYCVLVWSVNEKDEASTIPIEHFAMNEWVDLSGSFLHSEDQTPNGYSIRITNAELLTPSEYIKNYGAKEEATNSEEGQTVVCLEYEISHEGDGEVGLVLFEQKLIAASKDLALSYDSELWWKAEPTMKNMPGTFSLLPDTTFVTHIPFTYTTNPDAFQSYANSPRVEISNGSYELLLSYLPVKKVVDIKI